MPEELKVEGQEGSGSEAIEFFSPESVPTAVKGTVERAPETAQERAGEKLSEILSKTTSSSPNTQLTDDVAVNIDAKAVYDETDAEARVTKLVSLAQVKGVEHAVRVAVHLNDYYVLDRMHDELADKFYDALKEKGMIAG